MITKKNLIGKIREAKRLKSYLYILNIDNEIKFMFNNEPSWIFLRENNLSYDNIIQTLDVNLNYSDNDIDKIVNCINNEIG